MKKEKIKPYYKNKDITEIDNILGRSAVSFINKDFTIDEKLKAKELILNYFLFNKEMALFEKFKFDFHNRCADKFVNWYCGEDGNNKRQNAPIESLIHGLIFEEVIITLIHQAGHEIIPIDIKNSIYQGDVWFKHKDTGQIIRLELKSSNDCLLYKYAWLYKDVNNHIDQYKSDSCIVDYFIFHNPKDLYFEQIFVVTKDNFKKNAFPTQYEEHKGTIVINSAFINIKNINNLFI